MLIDQQITQLRNKVGESSLIEDLRFYKYASRSEIRWSRKGKTGEQMIQ